MEYTLSQYASKNDMISDMRTELAKLRAENERLRDALEDVILQDEYECIRGGVKVKDWGLCGQIAKEALK